MVEFSIMAEQFSKKQALRFGWNLTKKRFWFLFSVIVFSNGLSYFSSLLFGWAEQFHALWFLGLAIWILQYIVSMGLIFILIQLVDQKEVRFSHLFSQVSLFWRFLGVNILYFLIVIGGLLLLIIPGLIWSFKYMFASYLVIDKHLSPREALRESGKITDGYKRNLFWFSILLALINVLGAVLVGIGLLWTLPTTFLALVYVYRQLESGIIRNLLEPDLAEQQA